MTNPDPYTFRPEDGPVRQPIQIIQRFARSEGQSWGHFDNAREEARRYTRYIQEGPHDAELRSVWEANGWNIGVRPHRVLVYDTAARYHVPIRAWAWGVVQRAADRFSEWSRSRYNDASEPRALADSPEPETSA